MVYSSRYLRLMNPFMYGPDIEYVQQVLSKLSFYKGPISWVYDHQTAEAVKRFQQDRGILADGIVGVDTYIQLSLADDLITAEVKKTDDEVKTAQQNPYSISIDIEKRILTLTRNNQLERTYPVAVGRPQTPTPTGNWKITQKTVDPGGPFGARWMRLDIPWGGYGIHGTNAPESIGTAASRGCVRMYNEDVIQLYDIVPLYTPVRISGPLITGRILSAGSDGGPDVIEVQRILQGLGYDPGPTDGFYNAQTQEAVRNFQRDYGLTPDGIFGPRSYEALFKARDIAADDREP